MLKINSSPSLNHKNEIIIGNNLYRILKTFPNIINKYNFINNGEFKVTENFLYLNQKQEGEVFSFPVEIRCVLY